MYKPEQPSTLVYEYLFNYFGGDKFKNKVIKGASVQLAIRVYKDGEEIKFLEEPCINNTWLCSVFSVSFDREKLYTIKRNVFKDNLLRLEFGWDEIKAKVVGYSFSYESEWTEEQLRDMSDMPDFIKELPVCEVMEVTESEFTEFVAGHIEDFDISDNVNAQVPSVSYVK